MVAGYFVYEWLIIFSNMKTALANIPWNLVQASGGVVIAFPLYLALTKTSIINK